MYWTSTIVTVLVAGLPSLANGQESGWQKNQVNATMCAWRELRAAQVRDAVYLDGGHLYWTPGLADGNYGFVTQDGNPLGLIHTLNFSHPFNSSTNISSILGTVSLSSNGNAVNNLAPNYLDGALLANDHEFFLYGGLLRRSDSSNNVPPDANDVLSYQAYDYGIEGQVFRPGFHETKLPDGITRYVTYGGAANAPSENLSWYFGGARAPAWGPIYEPADNDTFNPINSSNTLITVDIGPQTKWDNVTLPSEIPSRANPSVVWVPVGKQGILVVIGGVTYPDYSTSDGDSLNMAQSQKDGPGYMSNIDIYDVANRKWYQQPASGAPPALAMGCAVAAAAQDFSSFNIYYYGGFDGLNEEADFNDDVWVLSLPSFIWKKLSSGDPGHARAGHQCVTPYPDQMISIGGFRSSNGGVGIPCLEGGMLQVLNLTDGTWLQSYDPNKWNMYGVPEIVHREIGGDYAGGATVTAPRPSGWASPDLANVFAIKYPASKITTYFPYSSEDVGTQGPGNGTQSAGSGSGGGGGNPSWLAPVLGVVLGLVFVTIIAVGIFLYRKKKLWWKKTDDGIDGAGGTQTDDSTGTIRNWLNSTREKAPTITTEHPSSYLEDVESRNGTPTRGRRFTTDTSIPEETRHEMPENRQRFELMDTSYRVELSADGLSHENTPNMSHSALSTQSLHPDLVSSEQPSGLSSSQAIGPVPYPYVIPEEQPDSSPPQNFGSFGTVSPNRNTFSTDATHVRNLSGQTVSSGSITAFSCPSPTPPPMTNFDAVNYMSTQRSQSPMGHDNNGNVSPIRPYGTSHSLRTSMFRENVDDLDDSPNQSHTR